MATTPFRLTIAPYGYDGPEWYSTAWRRETWKFQMSWQEIASSNRRNYE
jgi:hypothetical protein